MTHGNLEEKQVKWDFWPECQNCAHRQECEVNPRHPAYPHRWQWGHVTHPTKNDTKLIECSWVGTVAIGDDHTGCRDYEVDTAHCIPLIQQHQKVFALLKERHTVEDRLEELETDDPEISPLSDAEAEEYDKLAARWDEINELLEKHR